MINDPATTTVTRRPRTAVLGTGTMGGTMARRLLDAGLDIDVWDRSSDAAGRLAKHGAIAHRDARVAVRHADIVLTMLPTGEAVTEVMESVGVLDAIPAGATWVQMGTIGVAATERLAGEVANRRPDVRFVDAPVSGSREPAETGRLLILASGPNGVEAILEPVFAVLGRRTLWLGAAGAGSRLKLVLNTWLAFQAESAAECAALADSLHVPNATLVEALEGGPLASGLALAKLVKIDSGDHHADFSLQWALKDLDLAAAAADENVIPVASAIAERWRLLVAQGFGHLDISAARYGLSGDGVGVKSNGTAQMAYAGDGQ